MPRFVDHVTTFADVRRFETTKCRSHSARLDERGAPLLLVIIAQFPAFAAFTFSTRGTKPACPWSGSSR